MGPAYPEPDGQSCLTEAQLTLNLMGPAYSELDGQSCLTEAQLTLNLMGPAYSEPDGQSCLVGDQVEGVDIEVQGRLEVHVNS